MNLQPGAAFNPDAPVLSGVSRPRRICSSTTWKRIGNCQTGATSAHLDGVRLSLRPFAHSGLHFLSRTIFLRRVGFGRHHGRRCDAPSRRVSPFRTCLWIRAPNFDGGVVVYSINGGATWTDAGKLIRSQRLHRDTIAAIGNPLAGRSGFIDDSHGYISSRVNLSSLAGQNVRFRWRMGLDANLGIQLGMAAGRRAHLHLRGTRLLQLLLRQPSPRQDRHGKRDATTSRRSC